MNNFTKKLSWLIMSIMLLVSSSVWAETIDVLNQAWTGMTGTTYDSFKGKTATSDAVYAGNCAGSNGTIQLRSNNSNSGIVTTTSGGTVKKVTVEWNSSTADGRTLNVYGKNTAYESASDLYNSNTQGTLLGTIVYGSTSTELKIEDDYEFIGLRSASGAMYLTSISITWDNEGSTTKLNAPTFSLDEGSYTEAQSVTISCSTEGASIYYTIDGSDPTTSSTKYTKAITISKTTTLKAISSKDDETSSIVSATYTILSLKTIAEARAQETGSVFTSGIITSINTNTSGTTAYIQDGTAGICVYGKAPAGILVDENRTLTIGDKITVVGTLTDFKGLLEITSPTCSVVSSGNTVNPVVKTIAQINEDKTLQGILVKIENATVTAINNANTTISQGENTIVVRGISQEVDYAVNYIISLTGNVGCYDDIQIVNPTNVEVRPAPSIALSKTSINVPAEGGEGTIEVTCEEFEPISIDLEFYKSDGTTPAEYDWIYAEIDESGNVNYIIDENTGAIRSAYFKVYGSISETNEVYSELITITQAVPNVTSLPFAFEGGQSDILNTFGLTHEGLGSDYSSAPKLKFNDTDDNLILHFNERPGNLSFDIKGNGFSEGTFTVQTSKDGVNYTELESYTELGTTQHEKFEDLDENVRYIKWIYTEKVNGNVALGNIQLTKYVESQPYTLTIAPDEHAEIFVFYSNDFTEIASSDDVLSNDNVLSNKEIFISASAKEGYVLQSITVTDENGENITLNDVEGEEGISWTFIMPASNVTVSSTCTKEEPFEPTTYTLVKSADELSAGDEIIIVNVEAGVALSTEQKPNNRGEVAITIDESDKSTVVITQKEVQVLTLEASDDNWLFNAGNGYLYAAGSGKGSNYLRTTQATPNDNAKAKIEIQDNDATITFQGSNKNNILQYNSGSSLFSCYASDNQSPVQIYKKVASDVKYGDANGDGSVDISDVVVIVNYILNSGSVSGKFVFENADVNNDGAVDISDVVGVVNLILNGE